LVLDVNEVQTVMNWQPGSVIVVESSARLVLYLVILHIAPSVATPLPVGCILYFVAQEHELLKLLSCLPDLLKHVV